MHIYIYICINYLLQLIFITISKKPLNRADQSANYQFSLVIESFWVSSLRWFPSYLRMVLGIKVWVSFPVIMEHGKWKCWRRATHSSSRGLVIPLPFLVMLHTVDGGRNPKQPPGMSFKPLKYWDNHHPTNLNWWCRILGFHSTVL